MHWPLVQDSDLAGYAGGGVPAVAGCSRTGFVLIWLVIMFTGLVEGQGSIHSLTPLNVGLCLTVTPDPSCIPVDEIRIGDSISINGCCLTVVRIAEGSLAFEAGEETLSKTNLGRLVVGSRVNLERSLSVGARLGGHFVQGHVDGVATVDAIHRNDDWVDMWFRLPAQMTRLLVPKGSVAVDGISLTVVHLESDRFSVALIPHTLEVTTLGQREAGSEVNIELDILGKYIDRLLRHEGPAGPYSFPGP